MAEKQRDYRAEWQDFLEQQGYRPHLQVREDAPSQARLGFRSEGFKYRVYLDQSDPTYFTLSLSFQLADATDETEILLGAAHAVTRDAKGVKACVDEGDRAAHFTLEWFSAELPSGTLFRRMLSQCRWAADGFFERVKEMAKPVAMPSTLA